MQCYSCIVYVAVISWYQIPLYAWKLLAQSVLQWIPRYPLILGVIQVFLLYWNLLVYSFIHHTEFISIAILCVVQRCLSVSAYPCKFCFKFYVQWWGPCSSSVYFLLSSYSTSQPKSYPTVLTWQSMYSQWATGQPTLLWRLCSPAMWVLQEVW